MSILFNKRLLTAKIGTGTYPTDPIPVATTDAVLTRDLEFQPFQGATQVLDHDRPTLGAGKEFYTGPHGKLTFKVDLSGAGTAGTAPPWGRLMRMCGFSETLAVGVSATYAPAQGSFGWGSLYFNRDGELHKLLGCRGNVQLSFNKEQFPELDFEFWGLWDQTPTATAPGTPNFASFIEPIPVNKANTPVFTLDGYAAPCEAVSFNAGQQVEYRNVIGDEKIIITDRDASGSVSIEKALLSAKDFYAVVRNHNVVNLALTHGVTAGNIVEVAARSQLKMSADAESQGLALTPFDMRLVPSSAGSDELVIVVK